MASTAEENGEELVRFENGFVHSLCQYQLPRTGRPVLADSSVNITDYEVIV